MARVMSLRMSLWTSMCWSKGLKLAVWPGEKPQKCQASSRLGGGNSQLSRALNDNGWSWASGNTISRHKGRRDHSYKRPVLRLDQHSHACHIFWETQNLGPSAPHCLRGPSASSLPQLLEILSNFHCHSSHLENREKVKQLCFKSLHLN